SKMGSAHAVVLKSTARGTAAMDSAVSMLRRDKRRGRPWPSAADAAPFVVFGPLACVIGYSVQWCGSGPRRNSGADEGRSFKQSGKLWRSSLVRRIRFGSDDVAQSSGEPKRERLRQIEQLLTDGALFVVSDAREDRLLRVVLLLGEPFRLGDVLQCREDAQQ